MPAGGSAGRVTPAIPRSVGEVLRDVRTFFGTRLRHRGRRTSADVDSPGDRRRTRRRRRRGPSRVGGGRDRLPRGARARRSRSPRWRGPRPSRSMDRGRRLHARRQPTRRAAPARPCAGRGAARRRHERCWTAEVSSRTWWPPTPLYRASLRHELAQRTPWTAWRSFEGVERVVGLDEGYRALWGGHHADRGEKLHWRRARRRRPVAHGPVAVRIPGGDRSAVSVIARHSTSTDSRARFEGRPDVARRHVVTAWSNAARFGQSAVRGDTRGRRALPDVERARGACAKPSISVREARMTARVRERGARPLETPDLERVASATRATSARVRDDPGSRENDRASVPASTQSTSSACSGPGPWQSPVVRGRGRSSTRGRARPSWSSRRARLPLGPNCWVGVATS